MAGLPPISTQWFERTVFPGREIFGSKSLVRISSARFPSIARESMVPTRSSLAWDNKATVEGFGGADWKGRLCTPGLASVYCTEKVGHWCTDLFGERVLAIWGPRARPFFPFSIDSRVVLLARDTVSSCLPVSGRGETVALV